MAITLGISTCPNDTFIYQNLIEGNVKIPCNISVEYKDVQTLNEKVLAGTIDIAKISCAAYPLVKDKYTILDSGGAMGYGCGPLFLSSISRTFDEHFPVHLPGKHTTAAALFNFWAKNNSITQAKIEYTRFDELYNGICKKEIKQGVVIHEHRFTWKQNNLHLIEDLGAFWEKTLHVPIPLGCSIIKKDLGENFAKKIDLCIQKSLKLACERKEPITDFIRKLAQIENDNIILQHIKMFVNEYSMNRKSAGEKAMKILEENLT